MYSQSTAQLFLETSSNVRKGFNIGISELASNFSLPITSVVGVVSTGVEESLVTPGITKLVPISNLRGSPSGILSLLASYNSFQVLPYVAAMPTKVSPF